MAKAKMLLGLLIALATILKNHVEAQTDSYDDDYDYGSANSSGGDDCTNGKCLNEGCLYSGECGCLPGFSGQNCEIFQDRYYPDYILQTIFTISSSNSSFENAVEICQGDNKYGRIVSNASTRSVDEGLRRMWSRLKTDENLYSALQNQSFWVITGEYNQTFPDLSQNDAYCMTVNISGHFQLYPCSNELLPLCETPMEGPCYPEVAKQCSPPQDVCEYVRMIEGIQPMMRCRCRDGFEFNSTTSLCEDIDECVWQGRADCYRPTICQNTVGSYLCGCKDGKQGNGNDTCAYVLTMKHRNIDFTKIPVPIINFRSVRSTNSSKVTTGSTSSLDFQWASDQFKSKIKSVFSSVTNSVDKVVVKTVTLTNSSNASAIYDVYVNDSSISTTSLQELYQEADRQRITGWLAGSLVSGAPVSCTASTLRRGQNIRSNFYSFPSANPGTTVNSNEKCPNGRSRATVECRVKQNSDGRSTAYFDYRTIMAVPCESTISDLNGQFEEHMSPKAAEVCMSELDSLTAAYAEATPELISQAVKTMRDVADFVWFSNVEISVKTMRSMMNVANNINKGQKYNRENGRDSNLNDAQRRDILLSLERCSTHLEIEPSEQITLETDSVILQASNVLSKPNSSENAFPNGIYFEASIETENNFLTPNSETTQAAINEDVLSEAISLKQNEVTRSLQASVIYFTDSEFFPSQSYDYEVEQAVSLRISNLTFRNLERPIWFKVPPKRREKKADPMLSYYKCAYFEEKTGMWLSDGCEMIPGSNPPNCTCDHMTNFAVLVQLHPQLETYALEVFGKIFCSISIIGLGLTLFIHLYFPNLRSSQIVKIHCHLALCLLLAYIVLLTATERPRAHNECIASAVFLHFFLLSSWGWMLVECVTMYKKLVYVFSTNSSHYVTKSAAVVYCLSAAFALLTVLIAVLWYDANHFHGWSNTEIDFVPSIYISDRFCWLQSYPLIIGFLIPIGIMFLVNLVGSILIMRAITCGRQKVTSSAKDKLNFKTYFIRSLMISVLLGLCWVFAIPLTLSDDPDVNAVFGWLFTITNALQGFFIFLLSCVTREDVRKLWLDELKKFFQRSPERKEPKLLTDDTGRDTREVTTTLTHHESLRKTDTTLSKKEVKEETNVDEEKAQSREHFQMGETSSFHPKPKESTEDMQEESSAVC